MNVVITAVVVLACVAASAEDVDDSVTVEIGDSVVINKSDENRNWFPNIAQFDRNLLVATIERMADEINPDAIKPLRAYSKDGGLTWSSAEAWKENGYSWARLNNGTCLWLSYLLMYKSESIAHCRVGRSRDGLEYSWSEGVVDITPHKFNEAAKGTASIVVHRSIIEMPDGLLLATMYGRFAGDALDRCIVVSSRDGGYSWRYLSTMGCDPNIGGEGFNEPSVVRLRNGELFCFMRNQSWKPMYSVRSADGGKTWSTPQRMPEEYSSLSVDPDLLLLSDGTLACSAGRSNCGLMLSLDGTGRTWTKPVTIHTGPTTGYTSIREVAPNKLFYLHDVTPAGWEVPMKGQFHEVRGVFVTVKREDLQ